MTDENERREGGAWIGQHPDRNTQEVRDNLGEDAERVAVTNNESGTPADEGGQPAGHRQGDATDDDDVRRAGEND